jgi:hypothetical protein
MVICVKYNLSIEIKIWFPSINAIIELQKVPSPILKFQNLHPSPSVLQTKHHNYAPTTLPRTTPRLAINKMHTDKNNP